ncbi:MAG: hypothetical protein KatS3mg113_0002 [Planctomycetaceae bacterium]|nr:MAG: hypothetical protein KatS3mg113_0002 [Planctomycetaceae bacterium]
MLHAELKVLTGKHQGKRIPLNTRHFLVGREQDCHLRPNSDLVSRHHCIFLIDEFAVRVRDLGSTNGTKVNGELIRQEVLLRDGDVVSIGKLDLQVLIRKESPAASPQPAVVQSASSGAASQSAAAASSGSSGDLSSFDVSPARAASETQYELQIPAAGIDTLPGMPSYTSDTTIQGGAAVPPMMPPAGYPPGYLYSPTGMPPGYPAGYAAGYPAAAYPGYPAYPQMVPGYVPPTAAYPAVPSAVPATPPAPTAGGNVPAPPSETSTSRSYRHSTFRSSPCGGSKFSGATQTGTSDRKLGSRHH